jgi:hypothetical protein
MKPRDGSVLGAVGAALAGLLSVACHRGATAPRIAPDGPDAVAPSEACLAALRVVLSDELTRAEPALLAPPGGWTLATLDAVWSRDPNGYGFAGLCLTLPRPADAIPALRARLAHRNPLTVLEAASVLALLGERSGVANLRVADSMTQSGVEFFYARAALMLLGEPIPAALAAQRCSMPTLERTLACR